MAPMSNNNEESRTFLISVAAELAGMHAQTLRTYDRLGLVRPQRTPAVGAGIPSMTSTCCVRCSDCRRTKA